MNIPFNYQVVSVTPEARCMEVIYTSPGRTPVHVGVRIPNKGESLEAVIQSFAPIAIWAEAEAELSDIEVGTSGSYQPPTPLSALAQARADKLTEIADWRYFQENIGVTVRGFRVDTSRETRALLADAQSNLEQGVMETIQWKGLDGVWKTLTAADVAQIRAEVFAYVQACFAAEAALVELVKAATSVEEIRSIVLPEAVFTGGA